MADVTQTPADVLKSASKQAQSGTAGATIIAGDVVYKDTADSNKLKPYDNSIDASVAGIALNGAADEQPVNYIGNDTALNVGATLTEGVPYFASATSGKICPLADLTTGDYIKPLGVGNADGTLYMVPYGGAAQVQ